MATYRRIKKHQHYYRNPENQKISYFRLRKGNQETYHTGETLISKAQAYVELRQKEKELGSKTKAERELKGVKDPLVSAIWDECIAARSPMKARQTIVKYGISWTHGLQEFWAKKHVSEVNLNTVKAYQNWYLENKGLRGFFDTRKHLNMLLRYMAQQKLIEEAPPVDDLDEIINARTQKKDVGRVYTAAEIKAILEHADERTRLGVLICRFMGPRKGEMLSLKWSLIHLDKKKPFAEIWSFKNKKWRKVPIPKLVVGPLKAWRVKHGHKSDFVFYAPTKPDQSLASQNFDAGWIRAKVKAKIKNARVKNAARVHDLRHTFASQTARDGWPTALASYTLDMSIEEYETTYVHVDPDDVFKLMERSFQDYDL